MKPTPPATTAACNCQIRRRLRHAVLLSQIPVAIARIRRMISPARFKVFIWLQLLRSRCIQLIQSAEISCGQTASHSRLQLQQQPRMRGGMSPGDFRRLDQLDAPGTQKLKPDEHLEPRWPDHPSDPGDCDRDLVEPHGLAEPALVLATASCRRRWWRWLHRWSYDRWERLKVEPPIEHQRNLCLHADALGLQRRNSAFNQQQSTPTRAQINRLSSRSSHNKYLTY